MHSFLQVARESVNFAICSSPLETPLHIISGWLFWFTIYQVLPEHKCV